MNVRAMAGATVGKSDVGKCNIHFAKDAFDWIRAKGECVALAFDVKSFFDNLDHKILKRQWAYVLGMKNLPEDHYAVFKSLTRFAWVMRDKALNALGISKHNPRAGRRRRLCTPEEFRTKIREAGLIEKNPNAFGIPQGSPMSAGLSNIYMLEFDAAVSAKVISVGGFYRRYCDDILCIVPPQNKTEVEAFVMDAIKHVKLEIQPIKTLRHEFKIADGILQADKALQYLGFLFDGNRVLLRNAGLGKYYAKMRAGVRLAAATKRKADKSQLAAGTATNPIRRKKLNTRYSYLGNHNFIWDYAQNGSEAAQDVEVLRLVN
jgi:hypothetical protein